MTDENGSEIAQCRLIPVQLIPTNPETNTSSLLEKVSVQQEAGGIEKLKRLVKLLVHTLMYFQVVLYIYIYIKDRWIKKNSWLLLGSRGDIKTFSLSKSNQRNMIFGSLMTLNTLLRK